jgi:hypothetical protein
MIVGVQGGASWLSLYREREGKGAFLVLVSYNKGVLGLV